MRTDMYEATMISEEVPEGSTTGEKEKVTYKRHQVVNPTFDVKETAETYYEGTCVDYKLAEDFYDGDFKVKDMKEGVPYKYVAMDSETSDHQVYYKNGNVITCKLVGGDFDKGFTFHFNLDILKEPSLDLVHKGKELEELTLSNLEGLEVDVYHLFIMEQTNHPLVGLGHYNN